ncbi:chorismate mutase, partial [Thelephora terrestris]
SSANAVRSPAEYLFTLNLPEPVLKPVDFPQILYPNSINANRSIVSFYTRQIVPRITKRSTIQLAACKRAKGIIGDEEYEDDGNYGSAATLDVEVLQAISKRVHYGKFVSESKFVSDPAAFIPHIQNPNRPALEGLVTKPEVERKLLQWLRERATIYAQNVAADGSPNQDETYKIDVDGVVELYEYYIIPLTKEVEVDYLLQRLDGWTQEQTEELSKQNP